MQNRFGVVPDQELQMRVPFLDTSFVARNTLEVSLLNHPE